MELDLILGGCLLSPILETANGQSWSAAKCKVHFPSQGAAILQLQLVQRMPGVARESGFPRKLDIQIFISTLYQKIIQKLSNIVWAKENTSRQDENVNCKCVISNGSYLSVEIYTPKMHNLNLLIRKYQTNKNSGIAYKTNSLYSSQMSTTPYSSQIPMS